MYEIDIEKAIKNGEKNGGFKLSKKARKRYLDFFNKKETELKFFYEKKLSNKKQSNYKNTKRNDYEQR